MWTYTIYDYSDVYPDIRPIAEVRDETGLLVFDTRRLELAEQVVREHNAHAGLVAAVRDWMNTLRTQHSDFNHVSESLRYLISKATTHVPPKETT